MIVFHPQYFYNFFFFFCFILVLARRRDLKLIVTSATMNADRVKIVILIVPNHVY
jgi:hypothetical protein